MKFAESQEQRELRDSVRRFLAEKSPLTAVREQMDGHDGYDRAVWRQAGEQLGLTGIGIPEVYGGAGAGFVEQCIVLEEMGRGLYCAPYFAGAVLAATALTRCDDEDARKRYLPGIASGEVIATLAVTGDGRTWNGTDTALAAREDDGTWRLSGHRGLVLDGHVADLILAAAPTPGGVSLFAVPGGAPGLTATALPTLDQTRRLARLDFDEAPAELIGTAGAAPLEAVMDVAAVALAAQQLGGAQAALDMAVEYAKVRRQFDRPIGSFQAIKHKCADLLMEIESARSAVVYGAWAVAEAAEDVPVVAPLVKAYASETYLHAASENIQIHGGIGFTWEHDAHLYFKRAASDSLLFGDADFHRDRLADRIGI
ncbi:acyl-CoA/acyl-ACP dehydrogenase [Nonomuraea sp. K274]|uniref:Acyl-CoA/acyl-ACP dehydrogenase n=1 Tax=Nonomuraea cypriaca TaxID=1187855 RepID=A0A931A8B5_9ACTN|nr:acyl-CoA dehydrogenase family protein [Nonomuraea cypriaca]MBF8185294.1 acyl-CoA/acyl-ACP dehydrogenase [Nonomuraea cypriaca]